MNRRRFLARAGGVLGTSVVAGVMPVPLVSRRAMLRKQGRIFPTGTW